MTDAQASSYFNARRAPTDLASGRVLAPGETVDVGDLTLGTIDQDDDDPREPEPTHDQRLVDGGTLQSAAPVKFPTGRRRGSSSSDDTDNGSEG